MSDEIRAAAERCISQDFDVFERARAGNAVARAWLAEHPSTPDATPAGPPPAAPKVGDRIIRPAPPEYPGRWKVLELVESSLTGRAWVTLGNYWTRADAALLCAGPRLAALEAACRAAEDALVVAKQQLEFCAGRRQRGWDQAFVFERINTALVALALGAAGAGGAT